MRMTMIADTFDNSPIAGGRKMTLQAFIRDLALPNVFFHLVTAYDILRKQGVPLGKMDYLAPFLA